MLDNDLLKRLTVQLEQATKNAVETLRAIKAIEEEIAIRVFTNPNDREVIDEVLRKITRILEREDYALKKKYRGAKFVGMEELVNNL